MMARTSAFFVLMLASAAASSLKKGASFRGQGSLSDEAAMHSIEVLKEKIRDYKAINPLFSEESCTKMYETKLKLGSAVPPTDFVSGCDEVCDAAKGIKEYWGSGDMATYACETMGTFGCVWSGTPPVKLSDIGC
mmetsp:Transcript_109763/g.172974  ORF Transcript_109763/g.172974 Transcript_109763/m.172974 type:complete len:135 (-) Transcript_109763:52-456(-)